MKASANLVDRLIEGIAPIWAARRYAARAALESARKFDAAQNTRRTHGWNANLASPASETYGQLGVLQRRSRDLTQNNTWAARAVSAYERHMIGAGITPRFQDASSHAASADAKAIWKDWAETVACDPGGRLNVYGIQAQVAREMVEAGEVIVRARWRRPEDGLPISLQIQVIPAEHIDTAKNQKGNAGAQIVQGVQYSSIGQVEGLWLFREHPGDWMSARAESVFVPADDVAHIFHPLRAGQVRGIPFGVTALVRCRDAHDTFDARMVAHRVATYFSMFVTTPQGEFGRTPAEVSAGKESPLEFLKPGTIQYLRPGEEVHFSNPPVVQTADQFTWLTLMEIAAGYDVPYEVLTGDFSKVNYSSARLGIVIDFGLRIEQLLWLTVVPQLNNRIWTWLQRAAELRSGGSRIADVRPDWNQPRRQSIDPSREVTADIKRVRAGLVSPQMVAAESGYDPEAVMADIGRWKEIAASLGVKLDSIPADDANRPVPAAAPKK